MSAGGQSLRSGSQKHPSEPARYKERRASEQKVHEQLRVLLVAKEAALSAVAQM